MKSKRICIIGFSMMICAHVVKLSAGEAEKLLAQVEKAVHDAKNLEIEFQEQYIWKMTEEENTLNGTLIISGDDRFRIETDDQVLVSDGTTLWTYSKPSNRVLIDKLTSTEEALLPRQLLLQYTEGYTAQKLSSENVDNVLCDVLFFSDNEGKSFYAKWKIWIDPKTYLPKKLMQEDLNGNQNIYLLNSVKIMTDIDPSLFKFQIPEEAEVIKMQ